MQSTHRAYLSERIYSPFKIKNLLTTSRAAGVDPTILLKDTGLNLEDLELPKTKVSLKQLAMTYENLQSVVSVGELGLEIGRRLGPVQYGVYGLAIASSQTLGRGLDVVFSFGELEMPAVRMGFAVDAERRRVHYVNTDNLGMLEIRQLNLEIHVAMCWNFAKFAIREEFRPLELWFDYPSPTYAKAYEDYFECRCRFDMPSNTMMFSQEWLDMPLRNANPITKAIMVEECELALRALRSSRLVSTRVFELLTQSASVSFQTSEIASQLGMTNRQLRRLLSEEGTSPRKLLQEFRLKEAVSLLGQDQFSISDISERLKYSDPVSFRKAFQSWTGLTCGEYLTVALGRTEQDA